MATIYLVNISQKLLIYLKYTLGVTIIWNPLNVNNNL
jgi:hypothetical protein